MSNVQVLRKGELSLPEEISREYNLVRQCGESAIIHAINCGELLIEQKSRLKHGEFKPWIEANCEFTYHSAKKYMQVHKQKDNALSFSSIRQALGYDDSENEKPKQERDSHPSDDIDGCEVSDLDALNQQFGCIYADPPWLYGNQGTRAATGNHYGGMTIDEICALPVERLAAETSHLHLWTTNGFLPDAFRVIEAWGFTYKSCFVWTKPQMGIGNYWRVSHEFMLLGVRGSCSFADKSLMSWAALNRTKHSAKPDHIRSMIERASPGPRLELFARRIAHGWKSWGNEIEKDLFYQGPG